MPRFTAMTWNLENLYWPGGEYGPPTQAILEAKLANLASVIEEIEPDVLAVQEVGDQGALSALQQALGGAYPHARLSFSPDRRGIRVGFLSRHELTKIQGLTQFPGGSLQGLPDVDGTVIYRLGRGALKVTVEPVPGKQINLVTAHLKSKLLSYPDGRFQALNEGEEAWAGGQALLKRAAEAVALRHFVIHLTKGSSTPLILLGDLNDVPEAATNQILTGSPDLDLNRADRGDDTRLYNLHDLIPEERRFSRMYRGQGELIDHILVSRELVSADPAQQPEVDSRIETIVSIGDNPESRREATWPDHAPLFAHFEIE